MRTTAMSGNITEGYYFVLVMYQNGSCGYSEQRFHTLPAAKRRATLIAERSNVKNTRVCYQCGIKPVDIKNFI